MKTKKNAQRLTKFKATTLSQDELRQATGGRMKGGGCGTAGTRSVCHIDGTDDGDDCVFAL